jgi:hypothetical protein
MFNQLYESEFLAALVEVSDADFDKKTWLIKHFNLYRKILVWPKGLPPITHSYLNPGTIEYSFYTNYYNTLKGFKHTLDYDDFTLQLGDELAEGQEQLFPHKRKTQ